MDKIVIASDVFDDGVSDNLIDGSCYLSNSIACEELSIDTLSATIDCSGYGPTTFAPADADGMLTSKDELLGVFPTIRILVRDLSKYAYGEPVFYYHDGVLIGKFYRERVKRVGRFNYEVSCTSAIGLLENSKHYGGIYNGIKLKDIISDVVGGVSAYTVDPAIEHIPMYGWLPVATRRSNLHQLLFAVGASIKKDAAGEIRITALSASTPSRLPADRLFLGGDVDYRTTATRAEITEHSYISFANDAVATLYEGEVPAEPIVSPRGAALSGTLALFDGPMHDLSAENGAILESGVNYAVLAQSSACKLSGKKYTHTTRVITAAPEIKSRAIINLKDNVVTVNEATLVSMANSENVAKRVIAYYGSAKLVRADLVVGGERPGDPVAFIDPFGDQTEGFVQSLDMSMSGMLRASAMMASGYQPTAPGNFYTESALIASDGTFTVPPGVTKIRAALISGGTGGGSGAKGTAGSRGSNGGTHGPGGVGGAGGLGGSGGKILIATIKVTPGDVFQIRVGAGGIGGICTQLADGSGVVGSGADGTATTFGRYSSADGLPSESGYSDLFGGGMYAIPGPSGIKGGKGSGGDAVGEDVVFQGITYHPGVAGASANDYGCWAAGGLGGGAAAGTNGGVGIYGSIDENKGNPFASGGPGGKGGSGAAGCAAALHGSGGAGGAGGGGGGAGGPAHGSGTQYEWSGDGGQGGLGGAGGNGAPGCAIIYY